MGHIMVYTEDADEFGEGVEF
ncbi:hypothetical protein [Streptococcus sp.]